MTQPIFEPIEPITVSAGTAKLTAKWVAGYGGLWLVMAVLADNKKTEGFAVVLAWTIALGSFALFGPQAVKNLTGDTDNGS